MIPCGEFFYGIFVVITLRKIVAHNLNREFLQPLFLFPLLFISLLCWKLIFVFQKVFKYSFFSMKQPLAHIVACFDKLCDLASWLRRGLNKDSEEKEQCSYS